MKSLGWTLTQYDWCSYKKREVGQRGRDRWRHREDGHLQAKERGLEQIFPLWPSEKPKLLFPWSQTSIFQNCDFSQFMLFKLPCPWYFVVGDQANKYKWQDVLPFLRPDVMENVFSLLPVSIWWVHIFWDLIKGGKKSDNVMAVLLNKFYWAKFRQNCMRGEIP